MKYIITVKPHAKQNKTRRISETELRVEIKAPPRDGKANESLIKMLADFFHISQSQITIKQGASGRKKVVEIL